MPDLLSVSEAARRLGVVPRLISDLFYSRRLSDDRCPIVAGRRLIPSDYLPDIAAALEAARVRSEEKKDSESKPAPGH